MRNRLHIFFVHFVGRAHCSYQEGSVFRQTIETHVAYAEKEQER